ncbi:MAG: PhoH family protein [Clostridia bacterium]|nr:PhoH family protein [Clostridia bacterium]
MEKASKKIEVGTLDELIKIFGTLDENINIISKFFKVDVINQGGESYFYGDDKAVEDALCVVKKLLNFIRTGDNVDSGRVTYVCRCVADGKLDEIDELMHGVVAVTYRGKVIKCKTVGQKKYVDAIKKNTVTLSVGPAGTGKTYLAVALAVSAYKSKEVERIILTRPAVEAGEKLGFLPGDLQEKVNPYLRPLYDALSEMLGVESYQKLLEKNVIEIAPLAYMRGRTLNNAFIILDEAQNTTQEQMKMFLTRLGEGSKMVVTGDLTQIDLPDGKVSGLKQAVRVLGGIENIAIIKFTEKDVVRHPLVQAIVKAYESYEAKAEFKEREHKERK